MFVMRFHARRYGQRGRILNLSSSWRMQRAFVRSLSAVLLGGTVVLAACGGDKEVGADLLDPVEAGFPKDSLVTLIGKGPLTATFADTMRVMNGFRYDKYLIDGQYYEVLYYREQPGDVQEPVEQFTETPIVLKDNKVLGWGWKFYVKEGIEKIHLPTPLKEKPPQPGQQPASPKTDSTTKS
jgi:hypothetical protein